MKLGAVLAESVLEYPSDASDQRVARMFGPPPAKLVVGIVAFVAAKWSFFVDTIPEEFLDKQLPRSRMRRLRLVERVVLGFVHWSVRGPLGCLANYHYPTFLTRQAPTCIRPSPMPGAAVPRLSPTKVCLPDPLPHPFLDNARAIFLVCISSLP